MNVVPFGKYKGKPVETLRADAGYCEWLMAQDWFRQRYQGIYTLVINNFGEPSETPEHNRLQTRFLDDDFCKRLLSVLGWKPLMKPQEYIKKELYSYRIPALKNKITDLEKSASRIGENVDRYRSHLETPELDVFWESPESQLKSAETELLKYRDDLDRSAKELKKWEQYAESPNLVMTIKSIQRKFEVKGWDVLLEVTAHDTTSGIEDNIALFIELKTSLGDDYPAVLRQIKANNRERTFRDAVGMILVFDQFSAEGATLDQVRTIFITSGITVLSVSEIDQYSAQR